MWGVFFWLCVALVVYAYAGYPLLVYLLARLRRATGAYGEHLPSVTLLIAAYDEEAVIAGKLENSLALDYPAERLQILVAADGSSDGTPQVVRAYAGRGVELSHRPERDGKLAAITRAMSRVRGEVVVFSDANNHYEPDALRRLVAPFSDPRVGVVNGAKHIRPGDGALGDSEGLYWRYESFLKQQETRLGSAVAVCGEILALRRELFEPPPPGVIIDDFFIAMSVLRRGYRVVYEPRARSVERVSLSARDEIDRRAKCVAGRFHDLALAPRMLPWTRPLLVWQIVSHKWARPLVPFAMLGALLANLGALSWPAASPVSVLHLTAGTAWSMLAAQALFYALAWLGGRVERTGALGSLLYLPTYLVHSNLAALHGISRFALRRQTALWQRVQRRV